MIAQDIHGLSVNLKAPHDLGFLDSIGRVFYVFDQLISGHLCFGVDTGEQKVFVKYAGAPTLMYAGNPDAVVTRLRNTARLYNELAHPALVPLLGTLDCPEGFALVHPWIEGYALAPLEHHYHRFKALPLVARLAMFDRLADFVRFAESRDFLYSGLSNRRILVDFDRQAAFFTSINHLARFPAMAPHPKLAGTGFYVPPEGFTPGTGLDQSANAYALGALAFTFFGLEKSPAGWDAGRALLSIALQAVRDRPEERMENADTFQKQWRAAVLNMQEF